MTENCPLSAAEDSCKPASLPADDAVADREDAGVEHVQPSGAQPPINRAPAHAKLDQLRPRHDSVLPRR